LPFGIARHPSSTSKNELVVSPRYTTRLASLADAIFLREMVWEAASPVGRGERQTMEQTLENPRVVSFVEGWGRPGDHGIITENNLAPVGAAWFRIFPDDDVEGGFVGGETPELLIALVPEHRGKGVGSILLRALLEKAREEGMPAIGLNVMRGNLPAVALFRRYGFQVRRDAEGILTMQLALATT
jgi:ribosomal protein S18 acetylase RimI-like enzyme